MTSKFFNKEKTFIVAEIGNNHEGDFEVAIKMIEAAAYAGVDAVKFQTIIPEKLISSLNIDRINQLNKFRLDNNQFKKLALKSKEMGLIFSQHLLI